MGSVMMLASSARNHDQASQQLLQNTITAVDSVVVVRGRYSRVAAVGVSLRPFALVRIRSVWFGTSVWVSFVAGIVLMRAINM